MIISLPNRIKIIEFGKKMIVFSISFIIFVCKTCDVGLHLSKKRVLDKLCCTSSDRKQTFFCVRFAKAFCIRFAPSLQQL